MRLRRISQKRVFPLILRKTFPSKIRYNIHIMGLKEYHLRLIIGLAAMSFAVAMVYDAITDLKTPPRDRSLTAYSQEGGDSGAQGLYGIPPIQAKHGALSWDMFAAVKENVREVPAPTEGFPNAYTFAVTPVFTEDMELYDRQPVKIMGYMFPLDESETQTRVLMGPYPLTCPLHYHAPNNQILEVRFTQPVRFTWEPILVEGTFVLNRETEAGAGAFYLLENTRFVKEYPEAATE
jgi:hypothetical protein